ncbi:Sorting nexin-24 [Lamellibrachia satsuma]|nr:Sorting nexin-24 [Lamellibrachia satsuma]
MFVKIRIPSFRKVEPGNEKSFTVFSIEVLVPGKQQTTVVERRYTEFEELHKNLKRSILPPTLPSKTVLKWNHRILENRRQGLEAYLQTILDTGRVPGSLLQFLGISALDTTTDSMDSLDQLDGDTSTHQPLIGFTEDVFLESHSKGGLTDIIIGGVTQALYGSTDDLV